MQTTRFSLFILGSHYQQVGDRKEASPVLNISNTRDCVSSGYSNTEKRVEKTTRSGVFLAKFEVLIG